MPSRPQQHELAAHHYDTLTSLIQFHADFRQSGLPLVNFVSGYNKDLSNLGLSCVGLSLSLMKKLRQSLPAYAHCVSLVSCEEVVKEVDSYCIESPNTLKEHVLVAIRVCIDESRYGFVVLDPGYHVARPAVVLQDGMYPHTSWFVQSKTGSACKEYSYELIDERFMSWNVRETKNGSTTCWSNLIYVQKAFGKCHTITQKRALFYSFKSLVIRDRKGPIAGIYCWMKSTSKSVTIFYPEAGQRQRVKMSIDSIGGEEMQLHLKKLAKHFSGLSYGAALGFLNGTLRALKVILDDKDFVDEMLELDDWIEEEA